MIWKNNKSVFSIKRGVFHYQNSSAFKEIGCIFFSEKQGKGDVFHFQEHAWVLISVSSCSAVHALVAFYVLASFEINHSKKEVTMTICGPTNLLHLYTKVIDASSPGDDIGTFQNLQVTGKFMNT